MAKLNPQILRFDSLSSTNDEAARQAAEGAAEGVCVVAAEQTAGRGRLQRDWASPKDAGLYFSIILRPQLEQSVWPLLTLTAAVAVHDALLNACAVETDIKWPNDILLNEKKLCGILAETVETSLGRAVVVGIGINLKKSSFPSELDVATSLDTAGEQAPDIEVVLAALVRALESRYEQLHQSNGPDEIVREWSVRSSFAEGKLVRVNENDETLIGTTRGLERDGALRLETENGEIRIIRAGDVTALRAAAEQSSR